MISPSELRGVIEDIKRVGKAAGVDPGHSLEDDDDQSENNFQPRTYDIDRLHADDARDKVFVAILKALVARHNRPSSPKELSNCIMRHEFTMLGGATPYATVSSRISQHFKRILEHLPPRPPILGRVAHEKHTRKYFYYVASAAEQNDFLRKVKAGIIPINASGTTASSNSDGGSGTRKPKHTKKVRCMVPAVAVEPDFHSTALRRTRRAASADTTDTTAASPMSSSSSHRNTTASGANARPRRTSYDCGSLAKDSSADEHAETDSDTNPYARKRYKSVRSIVAQAYPRRRPRRQSGVSSVVGAEPVLSRTRRSSSYNDANNASSRASPTGAGKWRPNNQSGDEQIEGESGDDDGDVDMVASDDNEIAYHYGATSRKLTMSESDAGDRQQRQRRRRHQDSDSGLGTATGRRRNGGSPDDETALTPPPPNTTPRASASPDRTPYPPATSPSFQPMRRSKDNVGGGGRTSRHKSASSGELQIASPLLLPRGMVSLPLDGGSIFGSSSIADAALNVEPIAVRSSMSPEVSLRHFTPTPVSTSTVEGMQTDETHVEANDSETMGVCESGNKADTCADSKLLEEDQKQSQVGSAAVETAVPLQDDDAAESPESESVKTEQSVDSSDIEVNGGFDFSFHDLMDAELMSLNELDKLWTTSNPMASSYLDSELYAGHSKLEPIPEVTMEESNDGADSVAAATSNTAAAVAKGGGDGRIAADSSESSSIAYSQPTVVEIALLAHDDNSELSTKLTQKLLALKADSSPTDSTDHAQQPKDETANKMVREEQLAVESGKESYGGDPKPLALDSVESTKVLAENSKEHEETVTASTAAKSNRVVLPDPFADISPTAMVATKVPVSPRIVLTIVETVPVYMTVITTTEPAAECQGKWIVRRHRLLRLVENGYVNASSLLLSGGVASEQERSIVLSLEVGRFKWRRPQSKLYGTWIPLPRARALAATCSLNHRLGPFLNDNLESYFPAPLPTSFIRHLIMPFFSDSAGMLLTPSQSEIDTMGDANGLAKAAPASDTGAEGNAMAETAAERASGSTDEASPSAPSHQTATALPSTEAASSAAGITAAATAAGAMFGNGSGGLGIGGIQSMANSAMASYAQSLLRQPKQSISRSSTFGATARGTPSPSIIQSLAARGGSNGGAGALNFAGAAKAIFGSDDRQLQSFLQLLSAESPMLSTSIANELQADASPPRASRADSPSVSAESSMKETTSLTAAAQNGGSGEDPLLLPSPFGTKPEVKAVINNLAKSTLVDVGGSLASLDKPGEQNETTENGSIAKAPGTSSVALSRSSTDDSKQTPALLSLVDVRSESEQLTSINGADRSKAAASAKQSPLAEDTPPPVSATTELASASTRFEDSMDVDSAEHSDDDLDLRIVFSADDDDMDMICRSTPPSPPPPPHTPPRLRKLSSTPLLLSRPVSPTLSDAMSSAGDRTHADDQSHDHTAKQQQQDQTAALQERQRVRQQQHGIGSFNARLAQSMEAFGFTGTAKASLLLRLRAAAAAKSTGRQQAVAPYMLYRGGAAGAGGVAGIAAAGSGGAGSGGSGGNKRLKGSLSDLDLGGGVRKRARVVRVARAKPGTAKQGSSGALVPPLPSKKAANSARAKNKAAVPDASVVLRLASAIYNHTLNLTAIAHSQRQAAAEAAAQNAGSANSTQTEAASASSSGSGSLQGNQQQQTKAPMPMRSPPNGRSPVTATTPGGRPPLQRPTPRPSPQQQQQKAPFVGNHPPQQRPAMQRPGGSNSRPGLHPPQRAQQQLPAARPPPSGTRPPPQSTAGVQRMAPGMQRPAQHHPMVRRPPLPHQQQARPRPPVRGPMQRPPPAHQRPPTAGRLPQGSPVRPHPVLRSNTTGSSPNKPSAGNAQQQTDDPVSSTVTSAATAASPTAVSISSAKTHKPQKAA
ncbi:hypothetical protein EV175_000338 [Coemansia sp. RSA 1933]|nr:hypothetical protein EV175_000338 [Coemansia sp. RSA 1933]